MCGIAGFTGFGSSTDLTAMMESLSHRGPDGEGQWIADDGSLFLGHRRLSIIDIEGGAQPMWDKAGEIGIVFNGEIYNHMELRCELEASGHRFRSSHSDTEVLIIGYRAWGEDLLLRLNGMFAFCIYDRLRRKLLLARDRFGEKPLYVYHQPGRLAFSSELTALGRHSGIDVEIDRRAIQKLFAWGFIPSPHSFYRNCRKLTPGSALAYDLSNDTLKQWRYWTFRLDPDEGLTDADAPRLAEELRHLFEQAVRRRLISDVPLGLFLSGGVDSGGVLAAAARLLPPERISTFTVGFTERSYDESAFAASLAHHFGVSHHEQILNMEVARLAMPDVLSRLDEPIADASIIPTYLLSRFARRSVTVALSGDGGDELFAGYDPFKALAPARLYSRLIPLGLHRGLRHLVDLLPCSTSNMSLDFKLRRSLAGLSWPEQYWNPVWLSPANPDIIADIFDEPLEAEDLYEEAISLWSASSGDLVDKTLEFYTTFYLSDDILAKVDRAAMMASLESRAVFLDNDLVNFCQHLPNRFKFRNGERKWLLKQAFQPWLPAETLNRRKKGFGIPLAKWLRQWPVPTAGAGQICCGGMNHAALERRWKSHVSSRSDERMLLFAWLTVAHHAGHFAMPVSP